MRFFFVRVALAAAVGGSSNRTTYDRRRTTEPYGREEICRAAVGADASWARTLVSSAIAEATGKGIRNLPVQGLYPPADRIVGDVVYGLDFFGPVSRAIAARGEPGDLLATCVRAAAEGRAVRIAVAGGSVTAGHQACAPMRGGNESGACAWPTLLPAVWKAGGLAPVADVVNFAKPGNDIEMMRHIMIAHDFSDWAPDVVLVATSTTTTTRRNSPRTTTRSSRRTSRTSSKTSGNASPTAPAARVPRSSSSRTRSPASTIRSRA